ncbi:MAG: FxLYD domain-containing protein [Alphaproteobacteria bacterium]|nr:FxLYD domain-containing protein [Alphaproteobacteria bacterium]
MTENEEVKEENAAPEAPVEEAAPVAPVEEIPSEPVAPVEEAPAGETSAEISEPVAEAPVAETPVSASDVNAIKEVKELAGLIKDKNYGDASRKAAGLSKALYDKHLKGKYVEVRGKKIPLTAVVVAGVFLFFYIIWPSSEPVKPAPAPKAEVTQIAPKAETPKADENTYDKDGLKISELSKCEQGVCGKVENSGENTFKSVVISISFFDDKGELIYEGGVEAADVAPNTKMNLNIPTEGEFATFKLKEVNATK